MSKIQTLDIRYDPDYPFDSPEYYEDMAPKEPRFFKYRWNTGVRIGPLEFHRESVRTGGFDPYSGERWTCEFGPFTLTVSNLICDTLELKFFFEVPWWQIKHMLWMANEPTYVKKTLIWKAWLNRPAWYYRFLFDFLEVRYVWWRHDTYSPEEDYHSLSYYE